MLLGTPLGTNKHIGNLRRGPFWEPDGNKYLGISKGTTQWEQTPKKHRTPILSCSIVLGVIGTW